MSGPVSLYVKLILTVVNIYSFYLAVRPPPPQDGKKVEKKKVHDSGPLAQFLNVMIVLLPFQRGVYVALMSFEFMSTAMQILDLQSGHTTGPRSWPFQNNERGYLDAYFIIGSLVLRIGSALRLKCYFVMDDQFTFAITELKNHKLITTGPYSVVRHPAYLASFLARLGACTTLYCPGTWLQESGILYSAVWGTIIGLWTVLTATIGTVLPLRMSTEDELLHKRFGNEWEAYAARVKYKLIPGVL